MYEGLAGMLFLRKKHCCTLVTDIRTHDLLVTTAVVSVGHAFNIYSFIFLCKGIKDFEVCLHLNHQREKEVVWVGGWVG